MQKYSVTKQKLVAKIVATNVGCLFVIYLFFNYVQYESNNNFPKNYCSVIPHGWYMSFVKS